jgi:hypothetical protein
MQLPPRGRLTAERKMSESSQPRSSHAREPNQRPQHEAHSRRIRDARAPRRRGADERLGVRALLALTAKRPIEGKRRGDYICLTPAGLRALQRWLSTSAHDFVVGVPPDPLRTRVRFLGGVGTGCPARVRGESVPSGDRSLAPRDTGLCTPPARHPRVPHRERCTAVHAEPLRVSSGSGRYIEHPLPNGPSIADTSILHAARVGSRRATHRDRRTTV